VYCWAESHVVILVAEYHHCGRIRVCQLFVKQWLYHLHFDKYSETYCIGIALFLILCAKKHNVVQTLCVCVCVYTLPWYCMPHG